MSDKEWEMASNLSNTQSVKKALLKYSESNSYDNAVGLVLEVSKGLMPCMMCNVLEREYCIEERLGERLKKEQLQQTNQELLEALEGIASRTQDTNLLWWQQAARESITNAKQSLGDSDES